MAALTIVGLPNPRTGAGISSGVPGESAAMLASGHWIPKKMPMHVVYPRPDSETQAHARHRNFHSSFRYEIPIGVQGGAYPFLYQLIEGPPGAYVGQTFLETEYGVLTWTPSGQTTSQRFTIQVVDQDGDKVTITWVAAYNNGAFVFIDGSVVSAGDGSFASPLKTFADWYKNNQNDATYLNKIAVFRGTGTYTLTGDTSNGNVFLNATAKTPTVIGDPDAIATLDCGTGKFYTAARVDDMYFAHLKFVNARNDILNPHYFWLTSNPYRASFFKCDFSDISHGTAEYGSGDNPAPIFMSGGEADYFLEKRNVYHDFENNGSGNGGYCIVYRFNYVLFEDSIAYNTDTGAGWHAKGTVSKMTMRNITAVNNVIGCQIRIGFGAESGRVPSDHEMCYNNISVPWASDLCMGAVGSNYYAGVSGQVWVYRNTFLGASSWIRYPGVNDHKVDANIVVTNNLPRWELDSMQTEIANVVTTDPANLVDDTTGNLIGAGLTYLYTKGHEVG
jgi:hypothetical protein